ncbi:hypothetical protein DIPPA_28994 [Diplonema papillatum]|nr:hypothetical protein DIPPA_28994 [Diplonema papillatum]
MAAIDPKMLTEGGYREAVSLANPGKGLKMPKGVALERSLQTLLQAGVDRMGAFDDASDGDPDSEEADDMGDLDSRVLGSGLEPLDFAGYLRFRARCEEASKRSETGIDPEQLLSLLHPGTPDAEPDPPALWKSHLACIRDDVFFHQALLDAR